MSAKSEIKKSKLLKKKYIEKKNKQKKNMNNNKKKISETLMQIKQMKRKNKTKIILTEDDKS